MSINRLNNLINNVYINNISFIYGNTNDLFCDKKLRLSNFEYQVFDLLKDYRKVFINSQKAYFLDKFSYESFLGKENISNNPKTLLEDIKLIDFSNNKDILEKMFKKQFIRQLKYFIGQNIKSFYIIDSDFNNDILNIIDIIKFNQIKNNYFLINIRDINFLETIIRKFDLNNYSILELLNPENDEIYNLLELLRIKNNITFNFNYLLESNIKVNNLLELYEKIKDYKNTDITEILYNFTTYETNKDKTNWLEL